MPKEGVYQGTYKVRRDASGKQSIFVPATMTGDYALFVLEDGTLQFEPIGVKG